MVEWHVGGWSFLTKHAHVLLAIARDPAARLCDIAAACQIAERTAQTVVCDLEAAGYLRRERIGRRTHYALRPEGTFRHPAEAGLPIQALLEAFIPSPQRTVKPPRLSTR
ncbi:helix-turn-helix transcriptional regulator [Streptomyces ochraceiscleroticus]|uniref:Helix-turn-helix transcriptional regulator n=1 Tax=Streptomyces ochraceiscleroticus TaxID=47761 RepID=A0ABW1MJC5_9ACTN|nr:helix-turn-helix domain-containing protein [Streptomyces ochraceiscleroticus]